MVTTSPVSSREYIAAWDVESQDWGGQPPGCCCSEWVTVIVRDREEWTVATSGGRVTTVIVKTHNMFQTESVTVHMSQDSLWPCVRHIYFKQGGSIASGEELWTFSCSTIITCDSPMRFWIYVYQRWHQQNVLFQDTRKREWVQWHSRPRVTWVRRGEQKLVLSRRWGHWRHITQLKTDDIKSWELLIYIENKVVT